MKNVLVIGALLMASGVGAHEGESSFIHKETIQCANDGCEVVCRQPGDRWNSYLRTEGDIEVTYFLHSGVRQLKADMGEDGFTILDTHPELQSCRISGVK